eukprot:GEMP01022554.1.p2 GENE.GEMP01022554.1~~GEMP01022554.1.p2  ORF type:complete len:101 (+),score=0.12 GEMP01022554.1:351-653(+)
MFFTIKMGILFCRKPEPMVVTYKSRHIRMRQRLVGKGLLHKIRELPSPQLYRNSFFCCGDALTKTFPETSKFSSADLIIGVFCAPRLYFLLLSLVKFSSH